MPMIKNKAMLLLLDQLDTVQCTFDSTYVVGLSKLYTYKCKKGFCAAGDVAIVEQASKLKFVTVVSVDATPTFDIDASFDYAWIYSKVDYTVYSSCIEAEQKLVDYIQTSQAKSLQTQLTTELNVESTADLGITQL